MATKPIRIEINGDDSGLRKALSNASGGLGRFATGAAGVAANVGKALGGIGIAGAVGGAAVFSMGTDLSLMDTKIKTVFSGDSLKQVEDWAASNANAMGLTETAAKNLAAGTADLLKPLGMSAEAAALQATTMLEQSDALADWSGGLYDAAGVSDILNKAVLGERDGLKALGISISQAEVDQKALTLAKADGREEITALDKANATSALITEKSADALSAADNKAADAKKKLIAIFNETKETVIRKLMPALTTIATWMVEEGVPKLKEFGDWIKENVIPVLKDMGDWIVDNIVPALQDMGAWIKDTLVPALQDFGDYIRANLLDDLRDLWKMVQDFTDALRENEPALAAIAVVIGGALLASLIPATIALYAKAAAWWAVASASIAANAPIYLIIGALAALAAGLVWAYQNVGWFQTAVDAVAKFLKETLWPIIKWVFGKIWAIIKWAFDKVIWYVKLVIDAHVTLWNAIMTAKDKIGEAIGFMKGFFQSVWDKAIEIKDGIVDAFNAMKDGVKAAFTFVKNWISDTWNEVIDTLTGIPGRITSAASGLFDGVKEAFRSALNYIIDKWNGLSFGMPGFDPPGPGSFPGFSVGTPNIDRLLDGTSSARGGRTLVGERGPEEVLLPQGSQVIGADGFGAGSGNTFNLTTTADPHKIAREISWLSLTSGR